MENQRIRLSKKMLKLALIDLMQEKNIEKITVYSICEKAMINRTTFYKYYGSQYDLFEDIIDDIFNELEICFSNQDKDSCMAFCDYLRYMSEDRKKFLVIINSSASYRFSERLFSLDFLKNMIHAHMNHNFTEQQERYAIIFICTGTFSIICEWMNNGCTEQPEEILDMLIKLMS
ncbi:MAG: TetR/AcrR family transcriptional regulator [Oscillospiraceae bacterium]|nr:TetR/AcrR family transcriptional regulator [Oscillospiraceae bacterium]